MNVSVLSVIVTVSDVVSACAPISNNKTPVNGSYVVPVAAVYVRDPSEIESAVPLTNA